MDIGIRPGFGKKNNTLFRKRKVLAGRLYYILLQRHYYIGTFYVNATDRQTHTFYKRMIFFFFYTY